MFQINLPVGLLSLVLVGWLVTEPDLLQQERRQLLTKGLRIDGLGLILVVLGFGALQILLAVAVVVGLLWTLVEVFFGAQDLIELPMPHVGPFGLPLILLVGGLLLGWILALLSRWFAAVGGGRRATRARGRLDKAIGQVADRVIVDPISAVLTRHRETRAHLDRAGASRR